MKHHNISAILLYLIALLYCVVSTASQFPNYSSGLVSHAADVLEQRTPDKTFFFITPHAYSYTTPQVFIGPCDRYCVTQCTTSFRSSYCAYDTRGCHCQLGNALLGNTVHVRDIFLPSKLAACGFLSLPGDCAVGGCAEQQYLAHLAATKLLFNAHTQSTRVSIDLATIINLPCHSRTQLTFGAHIPYVRKRNFLDIAIAGGNLGVGSMLGENNITQYLRQYNIDLIDFIRRAVLAPKGITYAPFIESSGVPSWDIFAEVSYAPTARYLSWVYGGINLVFPGTSLQQPGFLWGLIPETHDCAGCTCFGGMVTSSGHHCVNPYVYASCTLYSSLTKHLRVPQLKRQTSDLLMPSDYQLYTVAPFAYQDTCYSQFADEAPWVRLSHSIRAIGTVGNFFENICDSSVSISVAYRFLMKSVPKLTVVEHSHQQFNTAIVEQRFATHQHAIFANLLAPVADRLNVFIGAEIICGGKNILSYEKLYAAICGIF